MEKASAEPIGSTSPNMTDESPLILSIPSTAIEHLNLHNAESAHSRRRKRSGTQGISGSSMMINPPDTGRSLDDSMCVAGLK